MAGFSDYLEAKLLDHVFRVSAYPVPTDIYVALCTGPPTDAGIADECAGTGYTRIKHNVWNAAVVDDPSYKTTNDGEITFPAAGASDWGTITHFAIMTAAGGGNLLAWGPLDTPVEITVGEVFEFADENLAVTLD